jgi:hypothetical protein
MRRAKDSNWHERTPYLRKRMAPGPPGVFGMDEVDIIVVGHSDGGGSASCTGFAKQSLGLRLEVILIRMRDEMTDLDGTNGVTFTKFLPSPTTWAMILGFFGDWLPCISAECHVWTAPGWQEKSSRRRLGRCSHVFGL